MADETQHGRMEKRKVRCEVRFTMDVDVPKHWSRGDVEFWMNESSLCASAFVESYLTEHDRCLCEFFEVRYVSEVE